MSLCEAVQPDSFLIQDAAVGFSRKLSDTVHNDDEQVLKDLVKTKNEELAKAVDAVATTIAPVVTFRDFQKQISKFEVADLENFVKTPKLPKPVPKVENVKKGPAKLSLWKVDPIKKNAAW